MQKGKKVAWRPGLPALMLFAAVVLALNPILRLMSMNAAISTSFVVGAIALPLFVYVMSRVMRGAAGPQRALAITLLGTAFVSYFAFACFSLGVYGHRWAVYSQQTELLPAHEVVASGGRLPDSETQRLRGIIKSDDYLISSAVAAAHLLKRSHLATDVWRNEFAERLELTVGWERKFYAPFKDWANGEGAWPRDAPPPPSIMDLLTIPVYWQIGLNEFFWLS